ncbi:type II secretion system protein F [Alsobacter soli]|uniref:Type II secretion system protein F n=1 Tax=Alsobacter soli TaxID=2109933 RepID=A0A2T1HQ21_9HYPH|nr:type II secretion system F family protein [Alsobacter soli]PSC03754.1 type II secretion system protein F [Alsobacter soli]
MLGLDFDPLYVVLGFAALAAVLVAEAVYLLVYDKKDYRSRVNRRLALGREGGGPERVLVQLRRERGLGADGRAAWSGMLHRMVLQSGVRVGPPLVATLAALPLAAGLGASVFYGDLALALAAALLAGTALPLLGLLFLRKRRQNKFAEQLPQAIDVVVRSLRAGYPVPIAVSMVAREMPDPLGSEFGMIADEITYGADLEGAMRSMLARVGQEDLALFVTSVAIQSTTGGNLGQILENLAKVIRERFKMRRKVKGLSAEGKVAAMILNAMPVFVFTSINVISPDFYGDVWGQPSAPYVLGGSVGWMMLGNAIMWRMINFKF